MNTEQSRLTSRSVGNKYIIYCQIFIHISVNTEYYFQKIFILCVYIKIYL